MSDNKSSETKQPEHQYKKGRKDVVEPSKAEKPYVHFSYVDTEEQLRARRELIRAIFDSISKGHNTITTKDVQNFIRTLKEHKFESTRKSKKESKDDKKEEKKGEEKKEEKTEDKGQKAKKTKKPKLSRDQQVEITSKKLDSIVYDITTKFLDLGDENKDRELDFEEFETFITAVLFTAFSKLDANHDGNIDINEIGPLVKAIYKGRTSAEQLLKQMDLDGSGAIDHHEFALNILRLFFADEKGNSDLSSQRVAIFPEQLKDLILYASHDQDEILRYSQDLSHKRTRHVQEEDTYNVSLLEKDNKESATSTETTPWFKNRKIWGYIAFGVAAIAAGAYIYNQKNPSKPLSKGK